MPETIALTGCVTLDSVKRIEQDVAGRLNQPEVVIDLAAVTDVDSVAVSLMLHWQRAATAAGRRVQFINLPAELTSLATLYGVEGLLALELRGQ